MNEVSKLVVQQFKALCVEIDKVAALKQALASACAANLTNEMRVEIDAELVAFVATKYKLTTAKTTHHLVKYSGVVFTEKEGTSVKNAKVYLGDLRRVLWPAEERAARAKGAEKAATATATAKAAAKAEPDFAAQIAALMGTTKPTPPAAPVVTLDTCEKFLVSYAREHKAEVKALVIKLLPLIAS